MTLGKTLMWEWGERKQHKKAKSPRDINLLAFLLNGNQCT